MSQENENKLATKTDEDRSVLATTEVLETTVFNAKVFESLYRIAEMLANSTLVPDTLKGVKKGGNFTEYPLEQRVSNCFLVVEQAHRWSMSPFAVISCASVVYGRLMWEGKLIAAVIQAKLGINLEYDFNDKDGDALGVVVSGTLYGESTPRTIEGTVGDWKTTGDNSPWEKVSGRKRQLRYRGAREWARAYAPAVILGVITDDEAVDFNKMKRADTYVKENPVNPFPKENKTLPQTNDAPPAQEAKAEPEAPKGTPAMLSDVEVKESAPDAKKQWKAYVCEMFIDGKAQKVGTFSKTLGEQALALRGQEVLVELTVTGKGTELVSIQANKEGGLV